MEKRNLIYSCFSKTCIYKRVVIKLIFIKKSKNQQKSENSKNESEIPL